MPYATGSNKKTELILKSNLTEDEKKDAYKLMGFVYLGYRKIHTVSHAKAILVIDKGYVESYKEVSIMY